jgi:hypothetical protein
MPIGVSLYHWILGYLDTWILGYLDAWMLGYLDTWIHGYFQYGYPIGYGSQFWLFLFPISVLVFIFPISVWYFSCGMASEMVWLQVSGMAFPISYFLFQIGWVSTHLL